MTQERRATAMGPTERASNRITFKRKMRLEAIERAARKAETAFGRWWRDEDDSAHLDELVDAMNDLRKALGR